MLTRPPKAQEALLMLGCKQVHTFFMRYAIDVVFMDHDYRVLRMITPLVPWRISPYIKDAAMCLEFTAGTAAFYKIQPGEQLLGLNRSGDIKNFNENT